MESCPGVVKKRAEILHWNGPGFQPLGNLDFIIARLANEIEKNTLEKISLESNAKSIKCIDWISRDYLTIHWSEYHLIDRVLMTLLKNGISFSTFTKFGVHFDPDEDKEYSKEIAESKFVDDQNKHIKDFNLKNYYFIISSNGKRHAILHEFNYSTEKGKNFCRELRQKFKAKRLIKHETCSKPEKSNYLDWEIFKNCNLTTLQTIDTGINKDANIMNISTTNDDEDLCIICENRLPNTIVKPCNCCVVCKECSDKLKYTADKKTCVACRNQITSIEECI